jgi:hypothetical protein
MVAGTSQARALSARLRAASTRVRPFVPVLRVLGFAVCLALVGWIAVTAIRDLPDRDLHPGLLVAAIAVTIVWWVLLAGGWAVLSGGRWNRHHVGQWCRTQALRYLPGGIWAPASRVAVAGGTIVDRVVTVAAENLVALCAALTVGGVGLTLSGRFAWAPLVLTLPVPLLLSRFVSDRTRVEPKRVLRATAGYTAAFTASVIAAVPAQAAVSGWEDSALVAGAAAVAWAAGLVVVIAPGGLGAREIAYVGLLGGSLAAGDAAAGAVMLRLVTIAAELLVLVAVGRPTGGVGGRRAPHHPTASTPG